MASHGRRRQEEPEEHENHERWLVTYADMVTLLMVLFIVMFSMSQVDVEKFNALKSGLASGFGQSTSVLEGSSSLLAESGASAMRPVAPDQRLEQLREMPVEKLANADGATDATTQVARRARATTEVERLDEVARKLAAALSAQGLRDDVKFSFDERGLVLSLVSQHVVFENDLAELSARGERVVDAMGPVLHDLDEDLEVSGNTNQVAVKPRFFDTDWDLSAARALTVLRRLNEDLGVATNRLELSAFGHTKPLEDPAKPGAQAVNKRVDIVVLSPADADTRSMLGAVAASDRARTSDPAPPSGATAAASGPTRPGTAGTDEPRAGTAIATPTTDPKGRT